VGVSEWRQYIAIENISTTNKVEALAIYGKSGSGKSSLIAAPIEQTRNEYSEAYIISRFIGVTSSSSNIQTLLEGLCREISRIYGKHEASIPSSYKELIDGFKSIDNIS
jgi:ABC-type lipoprotein export system ATPase subunit